MTSKKVGNGTHTSDEISVPEDFRGWLYFTETIAGDKATKEWKGIHGQPRETGFVPWTPQADTEAVLEGTSTPRRGGRDRAAPRIRSRAHRHRLPRGG